MGMYGLHEEAEEVDDALIIVTGRRLIDAIENMQLRQMAVFGCKNETVRRFVGDGVFLRIEQWFPWLADISQGTCTGMNIKILRHGSRDAIKEIGEFVAHINDYKSNYTMSISMFL